MRVIAGTRKGQKLLPPRGRGVRPTSDRVRTVLFDVLGSVVVGARGLDAFAGVGVLGVEALSRGARWFDFVEKSRQSAKTIAANLQRTHLENHGRVVLEDAFVFLSREAKSGGGYDLVLADPPYFSFDKYGELLKLLAQDRMLTPHGLVVLEASTRVALPREVDRLQLTSERRIGETLLLFYCRD